MSEHRYILEPYKGMNTRYRCPGCQQRDKTFSLYIDTETRQHLNPSVGRCNRESKCGYHYTPKQYFQDHMKAPVPQHYTQQKAPVLCPKTVSFIPVGVFKASLKGHEANQFVRFLIGLFGIEVAGELVSRYFIATSKHWNGATVFWQIDTQGKIRTGKIMLYSPTTGKRVKNLEPPVYWVHKALKQPEFELRQCLFGEHLLIDKTKPVAIVESEKTAVIASVYLPQFIWVAVGSLTNLTAEKCSILKGRTVTLFPDLGGFEKWSSKAKELSPRLCGTIFAVSDLLERKATESERIQGFDLADYLIRVDYKEFALPEPETTESQPAVQSFLEVKAFEQPDPVYYLSKSEQPKPENWDQDITVLEIFFSGITLPTQPLKLNPYSTVTDISLFIVSHFDTVKANKGKRAILPYLNRLQELKTVLTINFY